VNKVNHESIKQRASDNLKKWGEQSYEILGLCIAEEAGELAQAILQHKYEGGLEDRIFQEAWDLGALCLQVMEHWNGDHKGVGK
jgi:NTP pyrophosphatase (non-canonical NTP hydrolase)